MVNEIYSRYITSFSQDRECKETPQRAPWGSEYGRYTVNSIRSNNHVRHLPIDRRLMTSVYLYIYEGKMQPREKNTVEKACTVIHISI